MSELPISDEYVFAYGSLLRDLGGSLDRRLKPCRLREHRRAWNVAMDNTLTLAGYKLYLSAADSSRPAVFVTFLNLVPAGGRHVSGVLFAVDDEELAALDERERNYDRRDVTDLIDERRAGRVWTYIGKPEAERRFALGRARRPRRDRPGLPGERSRRLRADRAGCARGVRREHRATRMPGARPTTRRPRLAGRERLPARSVGRARVLTLVPGCLGRTGGGHQRSPPATAFKCGSSASASGACGGALPSANGNSSLTPAFSNAR